MKALKRLIGQHSIVRRAWHAAKGVAAALRFGLPARHLTITEITGTDGKTTTVTMLHHLLHHQGRQVGSLSTAILRLNDRTETNATQKTSPSPFLIQSFLRRLVREGITHAVLEASSHGLVQGRLLCTWPLVGGFTNLSPEHLDYHGTMAAYAEAKARLFRSLRPAGAKVLNRDDQTFPLYRTIPSGTTITYGRTRPTSPTSGAREELWLEELHVSPAGTTAQVHSTAEWSAPLTLNVAGDFNALNALCAIGCALHLGSTGPAAVASLSTFTGTPGRLERISAGQDFHVFVDFTVTPASYEATLSTLRASLEPGKRLLVVMGSCGDRMREKRPQIATVASRFADVIVVTNEDPYTEDPERIISEVWAGLDLSRVQAERISDRRTAIARTFQLARPGDIVVLCGKGSDTTMWTAQGKIPWDDRAIARELLHEGQIPR